MKPLTQTALLRRRCQRILALQKRRAARDGDRLYYGLDDLIDRVQPALNCEYCGLPVGLDLQLDHATPITRGGLHTLENLVVACKGCNVRKGQLSCQEYRQLLILIAAWPPAAQEDIRRRLIHGGRLYARNREKKG